MGLRGRALKFAMDADNDMVIAGRVRGRVRIRVRLGSVRARAGPYGC